MVKKKKGLSPVIATVLLIGIVVVIAAIVFVWLKGMTEEAVTKFDGQNIKMVCQDVEFDASYSSTDGAVYVLNTGNVPIYKMKAKLVGEGSHTTEYFEGDAPDNWPEGGLMSGMAFSDTIPISGLQEIILIPLLIGNSEKGPATYTCEEGQGYELKVA